MTSSPWSRSDGAGVMPEDLRTLGDIACFPFTAGADLRASYRDGMFAVSTEQV